MKISTKGRYAIRVMIDLAEHNTGEYITLMDIAERQEISEKYLESIVSILSKNGLLLSLRGKGGGYKLTKSPEEYTIREILILTEGSLEIISDLEKQGSTCKREDNSQTRKMWEGLSKLINNYLDTITIADLVNTDNYVGNYVI
ncbi:MAG: Rrf2 family transcriptional regulator [Firmicutes bacterium]|uniref:Rrf2 family transcriptional regulator n=1 Tax=Candidatus Scybalomonas excrementavium TaxID=2840943 RepID=A0A9D9HYA1_9FIRM|nr:Rrf2 family transcriptional regulator [Candidatus Scybalomonas excrementavium]